MNTLLATLLLVAPVPFPKPPNWTVTELVAHLKKHPPLNSGNTVMYATSNQWPKGHDRWHGAQGYFLIWEDHNPSDLQRLIADKVPLDALYNTIYVRGIAFCIRCRDEETARRLCDGKKPETCMAWGRFFFTGSRKSMVRLRAALPCPPPPR